MRINLFTVTQNNESIISDFIDFYKQRVPNINIFIWDKDSSDRTIEIAKEKECTVKNFSIFYPSLNDWKNNCWKNTPCDCVVIVEINEFVDITPLLFQNSTIIKTKGYDTDNLKELKEDPLKRNTDYDKVCIFDPQSIKEMNYDGNNCNPLGFVRIGEKTPILYNLK